MPQDLIETITSAIQKPTMTNEFLSRSDSSETRLKKMILKLSPSVVTIHATMTEEFCQEGRLERILNSFTELDKICLRARHLMLAQSPVKFVLTNSLPELTA